MYTIINGYWVGRYLGTRALAVITVSMPAMFVLTTLAFGITMAASILVSQAYGAKDWGRLRRVVQNGTVLTVCIATLCLVVALVSIRIILLAMNTPPNVLPTALDYMRIFLWTLPPVFLIFLFSSMLRGIGDSRTPLIFQSVGLLLTAILDPLLMFGWLGFPRLGLNGTAVATVFSNVCCVLMLIVYLHVKKSVVAPNWRQLKADMEMTWLMVRIGVPSMLQNGMISLAVTVITSLVNTFGEKATAAFGAAMRIDSFAFLPALTMGMAVAILSGQNIGAAKFDRVKQSFRWGLIISGSATLAMGIYMAVDARHLMQVLSSDPQVIVLGVGYLKIVPLSYVLLAALFTSNGVINGAGHTLFTAFSTFIALWLVRIPLAYYLAEHLRSLEGIWYAMVVGFATGLIVSLIYYYSGLWKRPVGQRRRFQVDGGILDGRSSPSLAVSTHPVHETPDNDLHL